jgi:hypothetical protein
MSEREMTLEEWVNRLPEIHAARREYGSLRSRLAAAEALLRDGSRAGMTVADRANWMIETRAHLAGAGPRCERCGDSGWIEGDPVAGISDEPCGHDDATASREP